MELGLKFEAMEDRKEEWDEIGVQKLHCSSNDRNDRILTERKGPGGNR
jgi:hypothetical protein